MERAQKRAIVALVDKLRDYNKYLEEYDFFWDTFYICVQNILDNKTDDLNWLKKHKPTCSDLYDVLDYVDMCCNDSLEYYEIITHIRETEAKLQALLDNVRRRRTVRKRNG